MVQVGRGKIAAEPGGGRDAGPVQYACFVPNDLTGERVATTWAMSYEKGHSPRWPRLGLPHTEKRQERYRQAIEACGGDSDSVHYDDRTDNILVRRNLSGGISRIVKLDVSARYAYKW